MLTENGELGPEIIIMINGRHIAHLGGLDAPLKSDDTVQIFPMVAGG
jgi:molybdopterin synthase sulfur carrier subunit